LWTPEVAAGWLFGFNGHLAGARPIDVLRAHGPANVLEALNAARAAVYP
jgi:hypothetical protein